MEGIIDFREQITDEETFNAVAERLGDPFRFFLYLAHNLDVKHAAVGELGVLSHTLSRANDPVEVASRYMQARKGEDMDLDVVACSNGIHSELARLCDVRKSKPKDENRYSVVVEAGIVYSDDLRLAECDIDLWCPNGSKSFQFARDGPGYKVDDEFFAILDRVDLMGTQVSVPDLYTLLDLRLRFNPGLRRRDRRMIKDITVALAEQDSMEELADYFNIRYGKKLLDVFDCTQKNLRCEPTVGHETLDEFVQLYREI